MKTTEHHFWDRYSVYDSRWNAGGNEIFSGSLESPPITEMYARTTIDLPALIEGEVAEVSAVTPSGTFGLAVLPLVFRGWDRPTLVWNHGFRERPFAFGRSVPNTLNYMFPPEKRHEGWNILVVRAPFHGGGDAELFGALADLDRYVVMMAAPAVCLEAITRRSHDAGGRVVAAGISLGGAVVNLHRACGDAADAYVPLLAGAASDMVLTGPEYRLLLAEQARNNPGPVHRAINFEAAFRNAPGNNVYPLLARHDLFVDFEYQKQCYGDRFIRVLERGHITGAMAPTALREHVISVLRLFTPDI